MTRYVLSNSQEVAHVWANQQQSHGRTSSNSSHFEGKNLYSYNEVIGRFCEVKDGKKKIKVVLLSNYRWSVTTSKHQQEARAALQGHDIARFYVSHPMREQESLSDALDSFIGKLKRVLKARNRGDVVAFTHGVESFITEQKRFAKLFKLKVPADKIRTIRKLCVENNKITEARSAKSKALEDKLNAMTTEQRLEHHDKQEKRKARARHRKVVKIQLVAAEGIIKTLEQMAKELRWHHRLVTLEPEVLEKLPVELVERYKAAYPLAEGKIAERDRLKAIEEAERIRRTEYLITLIPQAVEMWKRNELTTSDMRDAFRLRSYDAPILLRCVNERVETTRYAQITLNTAKSLFLLYYKVMTEMSKGVVGGENIYHGCVGINSNAGTLVWCPSNPIKLDNYQLNYITREGDIVIGCHHITKAEIDDFINRMGWSIV